MASKRRATESDPTHAAWMEARRPMARHAIGDLWREGHRFAMLDAGPRRRDRKGRVVPGSGRDERREWVEKFYGLRHRISVGLASDALTVGQAREEVARSEFAGELRIAASAAEAVELMAELLAEGNNAWLDGDFGGAVLWVTAWRE